MPRHTARALVLHDGQLLLMERWRDELHYFSIPGGGIESGETPEQTVVREIKEEMAVKVKPVREVLRMVVGDANHHMFICDYINGEPKLSPDSEEAHWTNKNNKFLPQWVPLENLKSLTFGYWQPLQEAVIAGLKDGFSDQVTVVQVAPNK